jgi:competence protein ComGC
VNFLKKGISLIALLATVAILTILVSTITVSGINISNNAKKLAFGAELKLLQESVDTYKINNNDYPTLETVVVDVSNLTATSKNQFLNNGESLIDNKITLYQIDHEKLNLNNLKYGNSVEGENDIYVVSKDTGYVYYAKGLQIGGKIYFTLTSDILKLIEYKTQKSDTSLNNVIIFEPSEINYTRNDITLKIKVPQEYTVSTVISDGVNINLKENVDGYNIYESTISKNSLTTVTYQKDATSGDIKATYNVNNIDKSEPKITVNSSDKVTVTNNKGEKVTYINIANKSDDLSGIKTVKYETYRVDTEISDYFENNGIVIKDNTIIIPEGTTQITVFIEDNALNWTALYVNV